MSKKFLGHLKNGEDVIIFNESNSNFQTLEQSFTFPTIDKSKEFETDYELDSDEWFFVTLDSADEEEIIKSYKDCIDQSTDLNNIGSEHYNQLKSLFLVNEDEEEKKNIIFNRIFPSSSIETKTFLSFEGNPNLEKHDNLVDFNSRVDAFWNDTEKKLYFRSYKVIKPIFKGIDKFYRTATQQEVDDFLGNDFFEVEEDFKKDKLGERLQKNIAEIIDYGNIDFTNETVRTQYNHYARDFLGTDVEFTADGKFKISKNKDLASVVKVLRGCYYVDYLDPNKKMETTNPKPFRRES